MDRVMASLLDEWFLLYYPIPPTRWLVVTSKYHLSREEEEKMATWFTILLTFLTLFRYDHFDYNFVQFVTWFADADMLTYVRWISSDLLREFDVIDA